MRKIKRIKVAPSILSADFSCLDREIKKVERAGADMLHIDVMDGHFVPNLTIGPAVVKCIRRVTRLPLDVHLMIARPQDFISRFVEAGSDMITVHAETISGPRLLKYRAPLRSRGIKLGVSLNPATPLSRITPFLDWIDFVLIMSVNPGFSGQEFIPGVLPKIERLRKIFDRDIAVDGGVNHEVAGMLIKCGADILASGSYVFKAKNTREAIERIRNGK